MKNFLLPLLFIPVLLMGCEEKDVLTKICYKSGQKCFLDENSNIILESSKILNKGICKPGKIKCINDNKVVICENVVLPQKEICDGLDNDCDGEVDENYDLDNDGFTYCQNDCDDTNPNINPDSNEICNNIDDNCNNLIDENVSKKCWEGEDVKNFGSNSTCKKGTMTCENGIWSNCLNQEFPMEFEICDGLDNDCDGEIDEAEHKICGPSKEIGACLFGTQICVEGETFCVDSVYPSEEICDSVDNDCDGDVDEGLVRGCNTACGLGEEVCEGGVWTNCTSPEPVEEICDGIDNDCDGEIDEDCPCSAGDVKACKETNMLNPTTNSTISCGIGAKICTQKNEWGRCTFLGAEQEQCNNWDDDCDGVIDDFSLGCGSFNNIGECRTGTISCSQGNWSQCIGGVAPETEVCDGLDNDCDGDIDEGLNPYSAVDIMFAIDGSCSMINEVASIEIALSLYAGDFIGTNHKFGLVVFPGNFSQSIVAVVSIPLTDIFDFQTRISTLSSNLGGREPSYDVMDLLASPNDPLSIGWRSNAHPYIILMTDENADTWTTNSLTTMESLIANKTNSCSVGSCQPGDRYEVFVITPVQFFDMWNDITFNEPNRLFNINPVDSNRYVSILRQAFKNVCSN